jgi:aminotransferase class I and II
LRRRPAWAPAPAEPATSPAPAIRWSNSSANWPTCTAGKTAPVFTSGYVSSETGIATIAQLLPNCLILSDAFNHNSMIEGVRRAGTEKKIWRHNDVVQLEELLRAEPRQRPKLIVLESLHSMDGDVAPINQVCDRNGSATASRTARRASRRCSTRPACR